MSAHFVNENVLEVRVPYYISAKSVDTFLESNAIRIERAHQKLIERKAKQKEPSYYYLGKKYTYVCSVGDYNQVSFQGETIQIEHTLSMSVQEVLTRFEKRAVMEILTQALETCLPLFPDLPRPQLQIRTMKTRWGTCAFRKSKITLNAKLIHVPYPCIHYVVVHELLHFTYPNHQRAFHEQLERLVPGHRGLEKELHEWGFLLED